MKNRAMVEAQLRKKISGFKEVAQDVATAAKASKNRALWKASREIFALASAEEEKLGALPPADPNTTAPAAPSQTEEQAARDELYKALEEDRLADAQGALAKLRRSKARAKLDAPASEPAAPAPTETPPEPPAVPVAASVKRPKVAPPSKPATAMKHPFLLPKEMSDLRGIIARVHKVAPDVAKTLRTVLREQ